MLRYKHMRLDQEKIEKAKEILKAKTETEAISQALNKVIEQDRERLRKKRIMKHMIDLRNTLGKVQEDSAEWVRLAREERALSYDRSN